MNTSCKHHVIWVDLASRKRYAVTSPSHDDAIAFLKRQIHAGLVAMRPNSDLPYALVVSTCDPAFNPYTTPLL